MITAKSKSLIPVAILSYNPKYIRKLDGLIPGTITPSPISAPEAAQINKLGETSVNC